MQEASFREMLDRPVAITAEIPRETFGAPVTR